MLMDEKIPAHYVSPMSTEDEMSVEDMLLEVPEEDLQSVAIVQGRMYMPLPFARKYILPTLRVHKALSTVKDGDLPGGIETAILYSIFDQSIIDFAKTVSDQTTDDSAIRAVMAYATDDTSHEARKCWLSQERNYISKRVGRSLPTSKSKRALDQTRWLDQ